jgi:CheY-like chemotaxis protein
MANERVPGIILIAEDDDDQYELTSSALGDFRTQNRLRRVVDGEELMDYLLGRGEFTNRRLYPKPSCILLDLNMPKKDGREALKEIKAHPALRRIPVTVFTVSKDDQVIARMYDLGANSYIAKPLGYERLLHTMGLLEKYWFETVEIPSAS